MTADQCSKKDVQRSGTTVTVDFGLRYRRRRHRRPRMRWSSGDFNSGYTVKVHSKREGRDRPGPAFRPKTDMTIEAKWLGACKADQKPGRYDHGQRHEDEYKRCGEGRGPGRDERDRGRCVLTVENFLPAAKIMPSRHRTRSPEVRNVLDVAATFFCSMQ